MSSFGPSYMAAISTQTMKIDHTSSTKATETARVKNWIKSVLKKERCVAVKYAIYDGTHNLSIIVIEQRLLLKLTALELDPTDK